MTSPAAPLPPGAGPRPAQTTAAAPAAAAEAAPAEGGAGLRLLLFTRRGCCLCEGLEERLRALRLPLHLQLRDVDADPALRERYDLRVPVLALPAAVDDEPPELRGWRELPAVPPRLEGARLEAWLIAHGAVGGAAAGAEPGQSARP